MSDKPIDIFCALDGPCLDGMYGAGGVMRLRYYANDKYDEPLIRFYDGIAGGHAVQLSKSGEIGHLGGFTRKSVFFQTSSLMPVFSMDTADPDYRLKEHWASPTHVVFLDGLDFIVAIGGAFYKLNFADAARLNLSEIHNDKSKILGHHGVGIPHAVKRSASGRYLFYGSMDRFEELARKVGIFDLETKTHRVIHLDETVWHLQPHPTEDCFYAVSECYDLQEKAGDNQFGFRYTNNYIWKIWANGVVDKKYVLPAFVPSHLSSDIVVMNDRWDTIYYNSCASSTITVAQMSDGRVWHIDEKASWLANPRAAWCNLVESLSRVNPTSNLHKFVKAMRISRGSLLDGSYGLIRLDFGPGRQRLVSAHRGRNALIVYDLSRGLIGGHLPIVQVINLPPALKYLPWDVGMPKDPRLGLHHCTSHRS